MTLADKLAEMQKGKRITAAGAEEITTFIADEVIVQQDQIKQEIMSAVENVFEQRKVEL